MTWDVFISHAREDNASVALPLAKSLSESGLRVWIDEAELQLGDSLRQKIDEGLSRSAYGVVILSKAFFGKNFPKRELDGLFARQIEGRKVLLPIWHGIDQRFLVEHAPLLADLLAVSTDRGLERVALQILQVVKPNVVEPLRSKSDPKLKHESSRVKRALEQPESWIGTRIQGYEIREFIGAGGSGIVFRAYSDSTHDVAIKVLYPLKSSLQKFTSVFTRGFRALAALQHPNIARLIDLIDTTVGGKKTFALCYEYIDGENLQSWSRKLEQRQDAFRVRMRAAIELAEALKAAHETSYIDELGFQVQGVLHGDVKPANVLVSTDNQIKLLDFMLLDIQRLLDPNAVPHRLLEDDSPTPITSAMGTPGFMAPEQENKGILSIQTDVYALGVTLCYLFFPTSEDPLFRLFRSQELPSDLKMLVISMTNGSPRGRPENMTEVSASLRRIESGFEPSISSA